MLVWILLLGLACHRPVLDPLAAERADLEALRTGQVQAGWGAHAAIGLSSELLNRALTSAISAGINRQMEAHEREVFGVKVGIRPQSEVKRIYVSASDSCDSCLALSLTISGVHELDLSGMRGVAKLSQGWTADVESIVRVEVVSNQDGERTLTASLAAAEDWRVSLHLTNLPDAWSMVLGTLLHNEVQQLVARPTIPSIPIFTLQNGGPVSVRDLRLRTLGDGALALELNFGVQTSGSVVLEEGPSEGWVVEIGSDTLLGVMQSVTLDSSDPSESTVVYPTDFMVDSNTFELALRALSTKKAGRFKAFTVHGGLEIDDGVIRIVATDAVLSGTSSNNTDMLTLLLKKKMLSMVADAVTTTLPAVHSEEVGENVVTAQISSLSGANQSVRVTGNLSFGDLDLQQD